MPFNPFRERLSRSPLNLFELMYEVEVELGEPLLSTAALNDQIDDLADRAARLLTAYQDRAEQAEMLATSLFALEGYRGNTEMYADPQNSFPTQLITRRLGIPITLSLLYLEVADRLNLPAYGIGLPGHFIVGVEPVEKGDAPILIDPFYGGMRLSFEDCVQRVSQTTGYTGEFREEWLAPTAPQLILIRMLNNLRVAYLSQQDWSSAETIVKLLQLAQPEVAEHVRDEGLIVFQQRRYWQAAHLLEDYLRRAPTAPDGDAIRQGIAQNLDKWVRQN